MGGFLVTKVHMPGPEITRVRTADYPEVAAEFCERLGIAPEGVGELKHFDLLRTIQPIVHGLLGQGYMHWRYNSKKLKEEGDDYDIETVLANSKLSPGFLSRKEKSKEFGELIREASLQSSTNDYQSWMHIKETSSILKPHVSRAEFKIKSPRKNLTMYYLFNGGQDAMYIEHQQKEFKYDDGVTHVAYSDLIKGNTVYSSVDYLRLDPQHQIAESAPDAKLLALAGHMLNTLRISDFDAASTQQGFNSSAVYFSCTSPGSYTNHKLFPAPTGR